MFHSASAAAPVWPALFLYSLTMCGAARLRAGVTRARAHAGTRADAGAVLRGLPLATRGAGLRAVAGAALRAGRAKARAARANTGLVAAAILHPVARRVARVVSRAARALLGAGMTRARAHTGTTADAGAGLRGLPLAAVVAHLRVEARAP